jgi:hypothetical protein
MSKRKMLELNVFECFDSQSEVYMWLIGAGVGLTSLMFALWLPIKMIGFAGFVLFTLFPLLMGLGFYRKNSRKRMIIEVELR